MAHKPRAAASSHVRTHLHVHRQLARALFDEVDALVQLLGPSRVAVAMSVAETVAEAEAMAVIMARATAWRGRQHGDGGGMAMAVARRWHVDGRSESFKCVSVAHDPYHICP